MGGCLGKQEESKPGQSGLQSINKQRDTTVRDGPPSKKQIAARATTWRSTGIVALRDANLKVLPEAMMELGSSVRTLDVTNNKISELPHAVGSFTNLQRLTASSNLLETLPPTIANLTSLKVMVLDSNQLKFLPKEVGQLIKLERLSLANNQLTVLPETIGKLVKLVLLDVSGNKLTQFPETIGGCVELEEIIANDNKLVEVAESVCELRQLKTLNLDKNQISKLPGKLLVECKSLQSLALHDNPYSHESFSNMDAYQEFESRRRDKVDKQIAGNVMMTSKNLDEGVDRK